MRGRAAPALACALLVLGRVSSSVARHRVRIAYHLETGGYAGPQSNLALVRDAIRAANATLEASLPHLAPLPTSRRGDRLYVDRANCYKGRDAQNTCTPYEIPSVCASAGDTSPSRKLARSHLFPDNYTRVATAAERAKNPAYESYVETIGLGIPNADVVVYLLLDCEPFEWDVPARPCRYDAETGMPIQGRVCVDPRAVDATGTQLVHDTLHVLAFWPWTLHGAGVVDMFRHGMARLPVLGGLENSTATREAARILGCRDPSFSIFLVNGKHWNPSHAGDDVMLECIAPRRKVGPVTLGLLNDTPWFDWRDGDAYDRVDFHSGGGCEFRPTVCDPPRPECVDVCVEDNVGGLVTRGENGTTVRPPHLLFEPTPGGVRAAERTAIYTSVGFMSFITLLACFHSLQSYRRWRREMELEAMTGGDTGFSVACTAQELMVLQGSNNPSEPTLRLNVGAENSDGDEPD
jgi:hypothetical protein